MSFDFVISVGSKYSPSLPRQLLVSSGPTAKQLSNSISAAAN
jgi:hypothetical protein